VYMCARARVWSLLFDITWLESHHFEIFILKKNKEERRQGAPQRTKEGGARSTYLAVDP